jgi:hypothetical protein
MTPEGGYVLLMTHFERLWHVRINLEQGAEKLVKIGDGGSDGSLLRCSALKVFVFFQLSTMQV